MDENDIFGRENNIGREVYDSLEIMNFFLRLQVSLEYRLQMAKASCAENRTTKDHETKLLFFNYQRPQPLSQQEALSMNGVD